MGGSSPSTSSLTSDRFPSSSLGDPHIERLTLDWDTQEKHRPSTTVNEGNPVTIVCEAFVVAKGSISVNVSFIRFRSLCHSRPRSICPISLHC